jgi:hypothetical protein
MLAVMKPAMGRAEAAAAVCELPIFLREHNVSLAARREELFRRAGTSIQEDDLVTILKSRPELMDAWQSYVEDQRVCDGWYMTVKSVPARSPQWIVTHRLNADSVTFDSRVAAFATLIAGIVGKPICAPG